MQPSDPPSQIKIRGEARSAGKLDDYARMSSCSPNADHVVATAVKHRIKTALAERSMIFSLGTLGSSSTTK